MVFSDFLIDFVYLWASIGGEFLMLIGSGLVLLSIVDSLAFALQVLRQGDD